MTPRMPLAALLPVFALGFAAPAAFAADAPAAPGTAPLAPAADAPLTAEETTQLRALLSKQKAVANKAAQSSGAASLASEDEKKALHSLLKDSWFEKLSIRGYMQFRTTALLGKGSENGAAKNLSVPADSTVSESRSFSIRRGRLVVSGDATSHLYVYTQMDFNGSVGGSGDSGVQARDYYGDISIDDKKEFRFRVGQSKVPFGWVNMQSSQNRAPLERPDALNSAVEGERDLGVYAMWAPEDKRKLLKDLVNGGLKGSGDYGVITAGAYSGQGLNRSDSNGDFHYVARASCPFELENGQIFEVGVQGYTGKFAVPSTATYRFNNVTVPTAPTRNAAGLDDRRAAATFVWFPQPLGFEAEYVVGEGPELNTGTNRIEVQSLHGGYAMVNYRLKADGMEILPFVRYNYYKGGRKFATNAPGEKVSELDIGFEFSPWKEVELTAQYTHTFDRTNTNTSTTSNSYGNRARGADRLGLQCQINF